MEKILRDWSANSDSTKNISASRMFSLLEESNNGKLDLELVQQFFRTMLPREGDPTAEQLRDAIEVVGQPNRLNRVIQSLLENPNQLDTLKSFGHSTGMERIELAHHGQYSLRLHFWMYGEGEQFTEDAHNHVYDFGSKVLSGVLLTDLFEMKEGNNMNMYRISSQNTHEKPQPELVGTANLQPITSPNGIILTDSDPAYTMFHQAIHRVRKGDINIPVITLNLRGGPVQDQSTFFRDETMEAADPKPINVDVESRLLLLHKILSTR